MINDDNTIQLWRLAAERDVTRPALRKLKGVESLAFSPDGRSLAASDKATSMNLISCASGGWRDGVELAALPHVDSITDLVFSPNGVAGL